MKNSKPMIAVIPDFENGSDKGYSVSDYYAIRKNYIDAITNNNGLAILLSYDISSIEQYINIIDGLLLVGGDMDIDPKYYGATEIHSSVKLNKIRENFEVKFVKEALKTKMPILGICNGMQLINVVKGGSLYQHLPDEKNFMIHEQKRVAGFEKKDKPYHDIFLNKNTKLFEIVKKEMMTTNSSHHQAVKNLGKNLIVSAKAKDGVIEAIEDEFHPFCVGVEWHPEYNSDSSDNNIFKALIDSAISYKNSKEKIND